jgi:maleylpyruvate isomerase
MFRPEETIERLGATQARLLTGLDGLTDQIVRQPSRLPGWSVGHVLSHLARNADSVVRRFEGAIRAEIADQYPGGAEGRKAEIDAGATASAAELVADVRSSGLAVERLAVRMPTAAWARLARSVGGELETCQLVLFSRIREVEVHHVDLGLGYEPSDWPMNFVHEALAADLPGLPERTDPAQLLAWLSGRGGPPSLSPWR